MPLPSATAATMGSRDPLFSDLVRKILAPQPMDLKDEVQALREEVKELRAEIHKPPSLLISGSQAIEEFKLLRKSRR